MGTVALSKSSNLYWLGRYTERVFTTLNSFFKYYDVMIDVDPYHYKKYLEQISVPDIYTDSGDFLSRYIFDANVPDSILSNLDRALGNGIVLRETIKTPSLSYLQMAVDKLKKSEGTTKLRYDLLPVRDEIYAFWGSIDNNMTDFDAKDVIYIGKAVERVDLFLRLEYPHEDIEKAVSYLAHYLDSYASGIDRSSYNGLKEVISRGENWKECRNEAIYCIEHLFEDKVVEKAVI
ncbi:MAG: alpha-E domain-containing protein [Oscillospiraceae bacterium]